jgi:hypothetical protein
MIAKKCSISPSEHMNNKNFPALVVKYVKVTRFTSLHDDIKQFEDIIYSIITDKYTQQHLNTEVMQIIKSCINSITKKTKIFKFGIYYCFDNLVEKLSSPNNEKSKDKATYKALHILLTAFGTNNLKLWSYETS